VNAAAPTGFVRKAVRRRFHPLERVGFRAATNGRGSLERTAGLAALLLGFYLRTRTRDTLLYTYTAKEGETVRIRVLKGDRQLADATIGS
jgi:hypothetical protein